MIELEKYFSKSDWENLVSLYSEKSFDCEVQKEFVDTLQGNKDLAIVIWGNMNQSAYDWINKKIPALDNIKPKDCLNDETLLKRLKVCLLRMP
jgi:hypothetical protein